MNKKITKTGGESFLKWWANPKNRQKVYASDKADAAELSKLAEEEKREQKK